MSLFKSYFKILKENRKSLFIYIGIFMLFLFIAKIEDSNNKDILSIEKDISILDNLNNEQSKRLIKYLEKTTNVDLVDNFDENKIKDQIFFDKIAFFLIIDKDKLRYYAKENNASSFIIKEKIESYLNGLDNYKDFLSLDKIEEIIYDDIEYSYANQKGKEVKEISLSSMYKVIAYSFMALIFNAVYLGLKNFIDKNMMDRIVVSGLREKDFFIKIFAASLFFILILWIGINITIGAFFKVLFTKNWMLYALNQFIFIFPIIALGEIISLLVRNDQAVNAAFQLFALGTSFTSGAFIPQEMISSKILKFASFFRHTG